MEESGAGFYPQLIGVAFIAVSLAASIEAWVISRRAAHESAPVDKHPADGRHRRAAVLTFVLMVAYVLALPLLGQYICAVIFLILAIRLIRRMSWMKSTLFGVLLGIATSALFVEVLGVQLPSGILG